MSYHRRITTTSSLLLTTALIMLLSSCHDRSHFTVRGVVAGADQGVLYLEHQGLSGTTVIDSAVLKPSGKFEFAHTSTEYPEYYRLRLDKQYIPLAIDSTETITVQADAQSFATSYTVEGSKTSQDIKVVWLAQLDANISMSKLVRRYNEHTISLEDYATERDSILDVYKSSTAEYIYRDPSSPVAYYALFQQVDDNLIYNPYDSQDSKAFAAVANVYQSYYPDSERTKHLYDLALRSMAVVRQQRRVPEQSTTASEQLSDFKPQEIGYFEIDLPDISGKSTTLSSVATGHPTLLVFSTMGAGWSRSFNAELHQIYDKYSPKGLRIYQVGLDSDPHIWNSGASTLPWANVQERDAEYSKYLGLYNISGIPQIYLIGADGTIVRRIESQDEIIDYMEKL